MLKLFFHTEDGTVAAGCLCLIEGVVCNLDVIFGKEFWHDFYGGISRADCYNATDSM